MEPGHADPAAPLIVTLRIDDHAQTYFDALRSRYFPPERLFVGAHVTLFHAIPSDCAARLFAAAGQICTRTPRFSVSVKRLRLLGRGVAFDLAAPPALELRAHLAAQFPGALTRQDSAQWSPHITVQNKVTPAEARAALAELSALSAHPPMEAIGLGIWRYDGGPWTALEVYDFTGGS